MKWERVLFGLIVAAASAGLAQAQQAPDQGVARERTGPEASPPPLPSFAVPKPALLTPPPAPPAAPAAASGESVLIGDVHIDPGGAPFSARPAKAWRPALPIGDEARLDYRPGEILDGAWVRRQFAFNHLIGAPTTPDRVVGLILAINRALAQNGYVNSGLIVPQQGWPAPGAVLDLQLVTGRVVPLKPGDPLVAVSFVDNKARGLRPSYVRQRLPAAAGWPLNAIDVEHDFRLLADDPAIRTVNAQLVPGPHAGEATMALMVDPQPRFDLYATVANSRSPSVGGERAAVGGAMRNALISGDVLAGEYGVTSGLSDGSIAYSAPVFAPGTVFDARATFDDAAVVDESLRPLNIRSKEQSYEVGLSQALLASPLTPDPSGVGWIPARSAIVGIHVEHRVSTTTLLGQPFSFSPGAVNGRAAVNVVRGTADFVERGERQVIAASASVSQGIGGTEPDVQGVPQPSPVFTAVLVQLNYARRLGDGGLEFRARAAGQLANGLLYSVERFSVGGQDSVRGYRENLLLADSGALASVELSCPLGPGRGLCNGRSEDWRTVRISVFVDGAAVKNEVDPQPIPKSIASLGFGLTWTPSPAVLAKLTFAQALVKAPILGTPDLQDRGVAFELTVHPLALFARRAR